VPEPRPAGGRALRRRARAVRRHLGPGPYLHAGCGTGGLLALLARAGSASGYEPDPAAAEQARRAAPGCPVHGNADAIPSGAFRGVVVEGVPVDAVEWARILAPGGHVLLVGDGAVPDGFAVLRAGREGRWSGAPMRLLTGIIDA
jgi:SAM-dependent methyltransferase